MRELTRQIVRESDEVLFEDTLLRAREQEAANKRPSAAAPHAGPSVFPAADRR